MEFGCCLPIGSFVPQVAGEQKRVDVPRQVETGLRQLAAYGYDFAELTVGTFANLSETEFQRVKTIIVKTGLQVPVCNSFIPPTIPLTGPEVSVDRLESYLEVAMRRLNKIGTKCVIFGSGQARHIPQGFPREQAMKQINQFLRLCDRYARKYAMTVAIEPLNTNESNLINSVSEALELVVLSDSPHIRVLADTYHMYVEGESFDIIEQALQSGMLAHVHVADRERKYPGELNDGGVDFHSLFHILKQGHYRGKISAECGGEALLERSRASLQYVRELWDQAN